MSAEPDYEVELDNRDHQREPIPQEFKSVWMSLFRAALCGSSVSEEICPPPESIAKFAAEIADEALHEYKLRFL